MADIQVVTGAPKPKCLWFEKTLLYLAFSILSDSSLNIQTNYGLVTHILQALKCCYESTHDIGTLNKRLTRSLRKAWNHVFICRNVDQLFNQARMECQNKRPGGQNLNLNGMILLYVLLEFNQEQILQIINRYYQCLPKKNIHKLPVSEYTCLSDYIEGIRRENQLSVLFIRLYPLSRMNRFQEQMQTGSSNARICFRQLKQDLTRVPAPLPSRAPLALLPQSAPLPPTPLVLGKRRTQYHALTKLEQDAVQALVQMHLCKRRCPSMP